MNRPPARAPKPSPVANGSAATVLDAGQAAVAALDPEHERHVLQAIRETTFGTIEVTIHQSRIVQITRSEKIRF
jgi:hypothetical protein